MNVLSEEKKQQVIALGRLGWSLRRIQSATKIRRETAAAYLRAAGIPVRRPGGWGRQEPKPAIEVSTDSGAEHRRPEAEPRPSRSPSASACEPYREIIESALAKGRNAMAIFQDLVDGHSFAAKYASVKRFVGKLRGSAKPEARVVIQTAPGEEAQVDYRIQLESRQLAPGTINGRLAAVRRLAYEAADSGLLSPDLAAGIRRVKGPKNLGVRLGNWLTADQARALLQVPDAGTLKGKRDRALLGILLGCGLRRKEAAELDVAHLQRREDHWAVVDMVGKARHTAVSSRS